MNQEYYSLDGVDDDLIRAERNKARQMRRSRWWQQKTSTGCCYYCGEKVGFKNLTMDHVIPLARGGRSTKDNLVPCCKDCNTKKKSSLPVEWEEYMGQLQERRG
ncbi:HNH endonuclease [Desulfogranum mediterraneum]|uniref:HNH endonuclease n=1 Tax=Desulfogranum mediterraneum TaxID=160661 RepID=UPI0004027F3B|nr:HNH endonuclease [Desulfogranum mediterraneum]